MSNSYAVSSLQGTTTQISITWDAWSQEVYCLLDSQMLFKKKPNIKCEKCYASRMNTVLRNVRRELRHCVEDNQLGLHRVNTILAELEEWAVV